MTKPELATSDDTTVEPRRIETVRYNQAFRLEDGKSYELYTLVDTHQKEVSRLKPLKIKDTHGKISELKWGTVVYPLIK